MCNTQFIVAYRESQPQVNQLAALSNNKFFYLLYFLRRCTMLWLMPSQLPALSQFCPSIWLTNKAEAIKGRPTSRDYATKSNTIRKMVMELNGDILPDFHIDCAYPKISPTTFSSFGTTREREKLWHWIWSKAVSKLDFDLHFSNIDFRSLAKLQS